MVPGARIYWLPELGVTAAESTVKGPRGFHWGDWDDVLGYRAATSADRGGVSSFLLTLHTYPFCRVYDWRAYVWSWTPVVVQ